MIPGLVSKVSEANIVCAATISPKTDVVHVTNTATTTEIATIRPPAGGLSSFMMIVNRSGGNITTTTSGNILTAVTIGQNVAVVAVFSKSVNKYIIGALA